MELKEIALYLDCDDTLFVPEYNLTFSKGILRLKESTIASDCQESVKQLIQQASPWYPVAWRWTRKNHTFSDKNAKEIRDLVFGDIIRSKAYDRMVYERILTLPEKDGLRLFHPEKIGQNTILDTIKLMHCHKKEYPITFIVGDKWRIEGDILYHEEKQMTSSLEETMRRLPDLKVAEPHIVTPEFVVDPDSARLDLKEKTQYRHLPLVFQFIILTDIEHYAEAVPYGVKNPETVREFYGKDCRNDDNTPEELCRCAPEIGVLKECAFSDSPIITDEKEKLSILKDFFPETNFNSEAMAYIEEFPILILEKGTVLCHSTYRNDILSFDEKLGMFKTSKSSLGWWNKYFVGHGKYGGGWFTYESNYGGPGFGMLLYYKIEKDIPLLFIPNYRIHADNPAYFPYPSLPWNHQNFIYTGSHIVQGPKNWKEKQFPPIVEDFFADKLANRFRELGFPGYISCDECEVFLTHSTMKLAMRERPFRVKYETKGSKANYPEPEFQTVFDSMISILCNPKEKDCPLQVKEGERHSEGAGVLDLSIPKHYIEKVMPFERFVKRYRAEK